MTNQEIIQCLKKNELPFLETKTFSIKPGIYALFYIGDGFPLLGDIINKHQIIYVGKTESSQQLRDAKTHFTSGKTGSSTVRKSIGSILYSLENLKPIPRNESDYKKGRISHFKFDYRSEEIITSWMKLNLALSFFEFEQGKDELDKLETDIIYSLVPIMNIDHKNPHNPYKDQIKQLRKNCALIAMKNFTN